MDNKTAWNKYSAEDLAALEALCGEYKAFLDGGKTERECVAQAVRMVEAAGYEPLDTALCNRRKKGPGDKLYAVCMGKTLALFHLGTEPLENGMNILGAHIDSPRVDVKQNPLYENEGLGYLDTHYYGGIKKYQWVAQPMALHGTVVRTDGTQVNVSIGEDPADPVLVFSDLLIHLAGAQMDKKAAQAVTGENLDLLVANRPLEESLLSKDEKEAVKANVLHILREKYDVCECDLASAELEIVPAGKARDCGLDRSMILAYGQDDRICAFTSLWAMLREEETPRRTSCCLLVDKEEIGSVGATGMSSLWFENVVGELIAATQGESYLAARRALANSRMLSSDVSAGYDPLYAEAFEKRSSAFLSRGMTFNKFTGSRGKSGSNDANAEFAAAVRKIMDEANVSYQFAELGKVDVGGGGTIAYIMARYGMEVIDSGVALLSMHAPYEVSSKADVYEAARGYRAFLKNA